MRVTQVFRDAPDRAIPYAYFTCHGFTLCVAAEPAYSLSATEPCTRIPTFTLITPQGVKALATADYLDGDEIDELDREFGVCVANDDAQPTERFTEIVQQIMDAIHDERGNATSARRATEPTTVELLCKLCDLATYLPPPRTLERVILGALRAHLEPAGGRAPNLPWLLEHFEPDADRSFRKQLPEAWLLEGCLRLLELGAKESANG